MTNWFCNNGDGLTSGYWLTPPWQQAVTYPTGSVVRPLGGLWWLGIAIDLGAGNIWVIDLTQNGLWNDSVTANPGTNVGGIALGISGAVFPALTNNNWSQWTVNFGASAFLGTPPTGFTSVNANAGSTVTLDPANTNSNLVLSNGNLTVSGQGSGTTNYSCRATASFTTGKIYFEAQFGWQTSGNFVRTSQSGVPQGSVGYANGTFVVTGTNFVGVDVNSTGYTDNGNIFHNNSSLLALHGYSPVAAGNERAFKNNGASFTSGRTQPSFPLGSGATVADGSGTWTECTGLAANSPPWTGCWARMDSLTSQRLGIADTVWVGDNHREYHAGITGTSIGSNLSNNYTNWYSVDHTNNTPGNATLLAGALLGFMNIIGGVTGNFQMVGFTIFNGGPGSGNALSLGSAHSQRYLNCAFQIAGGGTAFLMSGGGSANANAIWWDNCTLSSSIANQSLLSIQGGYFQWRGGSAVTGSGNSWVFDAAIRNTSARVILDDIDFTACVQALQQGSCMAALVFSLTRCKFPTSSFAIPPSDANPGYPTAEWFNCDTTLNQQSHGRADYAGTQQDNHAVVRTGGASDGLKSYSTRLAGSSACTYPFTFRSIPIEVWNTVAGASRTVTLYGISFSTTGTMPQNTDLFFTVRYLGAAIGLIVSNGPANGLVAGSNWTADTSAWDSAATARANSFAYAVGAFIKLASNPGRVFFCTAAGTSAGSEPAGYASAVDGTSVTDGGATFRAGMRFRMSAVVPSAQLGLMAIQVELMKPNLPAYCIDPMPVVA